MKIIKIKHFEFALVFGIGYWKDDYSTLFSENSYTHNLLLPLFRIQWGQLTHVEEKLEQYEHVTNI